MDFLNILHYDLSKKDACGTFKASLDTILHGFSRHLKPDTLRHDLLKKAPVALSTVFYTTLDLGVILSTFYALNFQKSRLRRFQRNFLDIFVFGPPSEMKC
uniref:Uncharacterized protein n=1 Tax=Cacopsylla melanoneura TaxID=428564 RepID=A0A8D8SHK4_9HEMI